MVPLLRSCILNRKRLFTQEIISLKRVFVYSTWSDVKKQTPISQESNSYERNSYENNENDQKEMVYSGSITTAIKRVKAVSLLTSGVSIIAQPILLLKMVNDDDTMNVALLFILLNYISICNPILIYLMSRRYVINMFYYPKEQKYVAEVFNFFFQKRKIEFTPKDITEPTNELKRLFTTFYAKNYPLLFDPTFSENSKHYFIIMGYKTVEDFEAPKLEVSAINRLSVNKLPVSESNEVIESKNKEKQ